MEIQTISRLTKPESEQSQAIIETFSNRYEDTDDDKAVKSG